MQLPVLAGREDAAQKLFAYNDLVMEMSGKINLTGIKDPEESLIKNVYDSLTVYDEKYFPENAKLLDLGTGAGFPGVPLAILRPDIQAVLADSIQKKLTFVENACQKLGIKNVKCLHIRAEEGGRRRKNQRILRHRHSQSRENAPRYLRMGPPVRQSRRRLRSHERPGRLR